MTGRCLLLLLLFLPACTDSKREAERTRAKELTVRIQVAMEKGCRHQDLVELEAATAQLLRVTSRLGNASNILSRVEKFLGHAVFFSAPIPYSRLPQIYQRTTEEAQIRLEILDLHDEVKIWRVCNWLNGRSEWDNKELDRAEKNRTYYNQRLAQRIAMGRVSDGCAAALCALAKMN